MKKLNYIRQFVVMLTVLIVTVSCDSFIYEDEGDCTVYYRLKLCYDKNLRFTDAFAHEVKSVKVFAFDTDGKLVWEGNERGEILASGNYTMPLPLAPGRYRLIAWCGLGDSESFSLPGATPSCSIEDLHCRINNAAKTKSSSTYSDEDLKPLFHGMIDVDLPANNNGGEYLYKMPLTKNTNVLRVVLQHLSGENINAKDFDFLIEDNNAWLAYDNTLFKEEHVAYKPWATYSGEAGVVNSGSGMTNIKVAVAEFTINRLFIRDWTKYEKPMLTIRVAKEGEDKGKLVASIPIIDYALLVMGKHHESMDMQEYLDRADEYNMTFFLDKEHNWASALIQVLSWSVVVNKTDLSD